MDRNTLNKNTYTFVECGEKKPAGDVVDRLVRSYTTLNPNVSYQDALHVILEIPQNRRLAAAYHKHASTLV